MLECGKAELRPSPVAKVLQCDLVASILQNYGETLAKLRRILW